MQELRWWLAQIPIAHNKIRSLTFDLEIFSDASLNGWGAYCREEKAHGIWSASERTYHINYLEILAAFIALKCFAKNTRNKQVLLRIDNVTALAHVNKMGGTKHHDLHLITKSMWEWCIERDLWIFAEYVASKENPADEGSRLSNPDTEWELSNVAFQDILEAFGTPTIDLFASRVNAKCSRYCS